MKRKIIILMGIALCTMLLISPALAGGVDTLEIYGNANEDDTIDMRDLTYIKLIFFGKKPETELADAKYDGKINPLDFIQIKLIIVGKEKELTVIDSVKRAKTFNLPINRLIALDDGNGEALKILGAGGMVVGVGTGVVTHPIVLPEMVKLPTIGSGPWGGGIDYEKVLSLEPDLFFTYGVWPMEEIEEKLESLGVQVLRLDCYAPLSVVGDIRRLGYIVGKVDKAEEFAEFHDGYLDKIRARTEGLSEDEKPRVYIEMSGSYMTSSKGGIKHDTACTIAGGINIAHNLEGKWPKVDPEWVVEQNPDIIIKETHENCGYEADDTTGLEAVRVEMMNRPELANVNAVKNGKVYAVSSDIARSGQQGFIWVAYMAKWFHPDLFEDLDPSQKAIHQEYIDRFLRIDYDLDKHGAFVYPPPLK
jgi:iron complex transport system substrate-binding protein